MERIERVTSSNCETDTGYWGGPETAVDVWLTSLCAGDAGLSDDDGVVRLLRLGIVNLLFGHGVEIEGVSGAPFRGGEIVLYMHGNKAMRETLVFPEALALKGLALSLFTMAVLRLRAKALERIADGAESLYFDGFDDDGNAIIRDEDGLSTDEVLAKQGLSPDEIVEWKRERGLLPGDE